MSNCDCIPVKLCLEDLSIGGEGAGFAYPTMFHNFYEQTPPPGWRVRNGAVLCNADTMFPGLWAALEKPENAWKVKTLEEWTELSNAEPWKGIGGVPFFAIDYNVKSIKLPDTRGMYSEDAGFDGLEVGGVHGDAIRNIIGSQASFGQSGTYYFAVQMPRGTGALQQNGSPAWNRDVYQHSANGGTGYMKIEFDASKVVPTANKNQPRAFGSLPCVYVGGN